MAYQPSCGMSLPAKTVEEAWNSAEFFANKLLKLYRPKPDGSHHVAWLGALKTLMKALQAYVKTHHPTGPAWNAAFATGLRENLLNGLRLLGKRFGPMRVRPLASGCAKGFRAAI